MKKVISVSLITLIAATILYFLSNSPLAIYIYIGTIACVVIVVVAYSRLHKKIDNSKYNNMKLNS